MRLMNRVAKLEATAGLNTPTLYSVRFVDEQSQARPAQPRDLDKTRQPRVKWGDGPETSFVYIAPGQSREDALLAAGIDPDTSHILTWN